MSQEPLPYGEPLIEVLPGARSRGFSVRTFRKNCVDFHWHIHPEYELNYIEKGRGVCHAGRAMIPYEGGEMFLLAGGIPHAYGSRPEQRTGARWTVMHFLPERWGVDFWNLPQARSMKRLLREAEKGVCLSGQEVVRCAGILRRLEENRGGDIALALWVELMGRLARIRKRRYFHPAAFAAGKNVKIDPRHQKVLAWIDENISWPGLMQRDAARLVGMSPQAFARFFRQQAGRPFHVYVNELRIAHACSALLNSDASVSEIAYQTGFNNLANFNRRFREQLGMTPREYRRTVVE